MRNHYHFPFFSQTLGGKQIATCTCGAQRRQVAHNAYVWRLPAQARRAS